MADDEGLAVQFRWLGAAGVELTAGHQVLAVDPFFTRPPFRRLWFGRAESDRTLAAAKLPRCDFILISHAHYDHLMDVPDVARRTGATVCGSPNACRLAAALGVPDGQIRQIGLGDRLHLGAFDVEVLPGDHRKTPLDILINAPLPATLRSPLRLTDYRMDACYSFLIRVGPYRILHGAAPVPADLWLTVPTRRRGRNAELLRAIRPQLVVPIHWDNFFRPLSRPIRPLPGTAGHTALALPGTALPLFRRMNPAALGRAPVEMGLGARVLVPEIFRAYRLDE